MDPLNQTGKGGYHSFLLRIWQDELQDFPSNRIILEDPHTHDLLSFSSLGELIEFLHTVSKEQGGFEPHKQ